MTELTAQLETVENIKAFITGGNATFTVVSKKTGGRFTYKVTAPEDKSSIFFVKFLSGSDNTSDYRYLGLLKTGEDAAFVATKASEKLADAPSFKAFKFVFDSLCAGKASAFEFWHQGRCARCNRPLTDPESIASGFGPVCRNKE